TRDQGAETSFGHSSTVGLRARTGDWLDAVRTGRHDSSRGGIGPPGRRAPGAPRPGGSARRLLAADPDRVLQAATERCRPPARSPAGGSFSGRSDEPEPYRALRSTHFLAVARWRDACSRRLVPWL